MKKILHILLTGMLLINLVSCKEKEPEKVIEPFISCESLDELNEKMGVHLVGFDKEAENEKFIIKNEEIAVYSMTINGTEVTLAASTNLSADVFEIYNQETDYIPEASAPVFYSTDYGKLARFAYDGIQYNLFIGDEKRYSESDFINVLRNWIKKLGKDADEELLNLTGIWYEEDKKGSMQIYLASDHSVYLNISIPEDEYSYHSWTMEASLEENRLVYEGSEHYLENTKDNTSVSVNDGVSGYLELEENTLIWSGSNIENTENYRFVKH